MFSSNISILMTQRMIYGDNFKPIFLFKDSWKMLPYYLILLHKYIVTKHVVHPLWCEQGLHNTRVFCLNVTTLS